MTEDPQWPNGIPPAHLTFNPFVTPYIEQSFVRVFRGDKDVTPEPNHIRNAANCAEANRRNAEIAKRYGIEPPHYSYDALSLAQNRQE
jgi:hypothetical protein